MRETIEPGAFVKKFCGRYLTILIVALLISDIIFEVNDNDNVTLIRSLLMIAATILGSMLVIKSLTKKYVCSSSMREFFSRYVSIAVVGIAILSILYFMYAVNSNVKEIKDTSEYKMAKTWVGETYADKIVDQAAEEAKEMWYTVWGVMIASSVVTIPITKKMFEKYTEDEIETPQEEINNV